VSTAALILTFVGALVTLVSESVIGPPSLPPETAPAPEQPPDPKPEPKPVENPLEPPKRTSLPPGLQPIPFPLEHQRRAAPPTGDAGSPTDRRRSIVDLRDPFDRPPARPRGDGQRDPKVRLLLPDLKDPFAPGVRRVRSKMLDLRVPNDIRDPFRSRPPSKGKTCKQTTGDGTVVQKPGQKPVENKDCPRSTLDLRDPFDRDPSR
jgi:hypothetical protein